MNDYSYMLSCYICHCYVIMAVCKTYYRDGRMTTVVNVKYEKCDVYIGRPSKWGNPFIIGQDGNRKEVIAKYKQYILENEYLLSSLHELKDKRLGCWCSPLMCHGNVLVELINEQNNRISGESSKTHETGRDLC